MIAITYMPNTMTEEGREQRKQQLIQARIRQLSDNWYKTKKQMYLIELMKLGVDVDLIQGFDDGEEPNRNK